jgi:hypothetical protein
VVARADGRDLAYDDLCRFAVQDARADLRSATSIATQVLEMLVEERLLGQAASARGITATRADLAAFVQDLERTHADELARLRASLRPGELERRLHHLLLRRRLEAAGVEVAALRRDAVVETAFPVAGGHAVLPLAEGVVLRVSGEPVADLVLGARLLEAGGAARAEEILERAVTALLAEAHGWLIDPAEMAVEIRFVERLAEREREYEPETVWETRVFHGHGQAAPEPSVEELQASPYYRALFGLVRHMRRAATEADVAAEIERERGALFGASAVVTWIRVPFQDRPSPFEPGPTRTAREARALARELGRRLATESPDALSAALAARGEGDVEVQRTRLHGTPASRLVFERARTLAPGEVSAPFETLAEVNVLRLESLHPPPSGTEVEPVARERLARRRTRAWVDGAVSDAARVVRRRPLPEPSLPPWPEPDGR